ncbi:MAG: hypothetical protein ACYCQK_01645 [Acidiferrobacteraceae bacterium]
MSFIIPASAVADPALALVMFLRATLTDQLAQATDPTGNSYPAVFRPDLPKWFDSSEAVASIVVRPAGGYATYGRSLLPIADPRLDLTCYGTTQQQATALARAAAVNTKQCVNQVWEGVMLRAINIAGGPIPLPDAQTVWPGCWVSLQVIHGELPQPADAA